MHLKLAAPLVLVLACPACFASRDTVNAPLVEEKIGALVPNHTTSKEVVASLGAPNEVVQLGANSAYRYDFTTTKRFGFSIIVLTFLNEDTRQDRAWLFFDPAGVLTHVGATLQAADTEYVMPWVEQTSG